MENILNFSLKKKFWVIIIIIFLIILFHKHSVIIDIFTIIKKAFNLNLNPVEPNKLDFNHKKLMEKKIKFYMFHDMMVQ